MEFLIFSDSHGKASAMQQVMTRQVRRPDAVLFLGDGLRDVTLLDTVGASLFCVRGNCDWFSSFGADASVTAELSLSFEGHRLFLAHGHAYGVKGGLGGLISHAAKEGADIVLYGHTHLPKLDVIPKGETVGERILSRPMYVFNPGSIGEGSFGTLTLQGETVLLSHGSL